MADVVHPLDDGEILRRLQAAGFCSDLDRYSDENPCPVFDRTLSSFLKLLGQQSELRRLPPLIADGQTVDLFTLFSAVRNKGGYWSISSGSWGYIAEEIGFSPITGVSLKSIYMKYLYALEVWLNVIPGRRFRDDDDPGTLGDMLEWVNELAKNPLDLEICRVLPDGSKNKNHGPGEMFSQCLRARQAMFLRDVPWMTDAGPLWRQDKRKMHPCLYEDIDGQLRSSQRIKVLNQRSNSDYSDTNFDEDEPTHLDKSRVGKAYQATLPYFSERHPETSMDPDELKWLGTRIWPCVGKNKSKTRIQEQIGKGREDECACESPGSIQCVRLHVSEKRLELMHELPPAFFNWSQGNIGEEVARSWTDNEQRRFKALVRLNPPHLAMNLWEKLSQNFPLHGRRKLVSYYFNVFVLRLRSYQNRNLPTNIDSDDEDNTFGFLAS